MRNYRSGNLLESWTEAAQNIDLEQMRRRSIELVDSEKDTWEIFLDEAENGQNVWGYPVLTLPLAGKSDTDIVCPKSHLEVAESILPMIKKVLVIGTSGYDEDVVELLNRNLRQLNLVHYVNKGSSATKASANRFSMQCHTLRQAHEIQVFEMGFRQYAVSSELDKFAKA